MRALFLLFLLILPARASNDWSHYVNSRFGFEIDVPPGFVAQPEPANGDGLTWLGGDNGTSLLAWGNNLVAGDFAEDVQSRKDADRDIGWTITYEAAKAGWAAYSGTMDGRIVYQKSLSSCRGEQAVHVRIEYPLDRKAEYDPIVKRLANSLQTGQGTDCPEG